MTDLFCPHKIKRDDLCYLKRCEDCESRVCSICKILLKHDEFEGQYHARNCPRYIEIKNFKKRTKIIGFSSLGCIILGIFIMAHKQIIDSINYIINNIVLDEQTISIVIGGPILLFGLILGIMYFDGDFRPEFINRWIWSDSKKIKQITKNPLSPYILNEQQKVGSVD